MPLWKAYFFLLNRRPLFTQMISAGTIGCTGDGICQLLIQRRLHQRENLKGGEHTEWKFDFKRSMRFFVLPCFFIAPALNAWFRVLERVKGRKDLLPLKRVVIDQICFAPLISCAVIFNLNLLEGNSPRESWHKTKAIYWGVYSKSIMYWPAVQLVNFYTIPLNFRVVFVQLAALFWNMFLSYKTQGTNIEYLPIE